MEEADDNIKLHRELELITTDVLLDVVIGLKPPNDNTKKLISESRELLQEITEPKLENIILQNEAIQQKLYLSEEYKLNLSSTCPLDLPNLSEGKSK